MSAVRKRSYSDGGEKGAGGDGGDTYVSYCNQFSLLLQTTWSCDLAQCSSRQTCTRFCVAI